MRGRYGKPAGKIANGSIKSRRPYCIEVVNSNLQAVIAEIPSLDAFAAGRIGIATAVRDCSLLPDSGLLAWKSPVTNYSALCQQGVATAQKA